MIIEESNLITATERREKFKVIVMMQLLDGLRPVRTVYVLDFVILTCNAIKNHVRVRRWTDIVEVLSQVNKRNPSTLAR